jgi:hypothetical protein
MGTLGSTFWDDSSSALETDEMDNANKYNKDDNRPETNNGYITATGIRDAINNGYSDAGSNGYSDAGSTLPVMES